MGFFSYTQGQLTPFELIQALMHVIVTCKYEKGSDQKHSRKHDDTVFPIITLWKLSVAMETRVLFQSKSKPTEAFPHPNDASDKISFQSDNWLQRYSCLKVLTYAWTHGRTHRRWLDWYKFTNEPSAQVS